METVATGRKVLKKALHKYGENTRRLTGRKLLNTDLTSKHFFIVCCEVINFLIMLITQLKKFLVLRHVINVIRLFALDWSNGHVFIFMY